ncbi:hypothetical protein [Tropicimonas sp. S265A]|uniref:hypothetical protein n=1 Tax=Tropicimonas sp. S265A TaxID=3415134 RepID=UPI003C799178
MSTEVEDAKADSDYREVDESSFHLTPEDSVAKLIATDRVHSPDVMPSPKALELLSIWQAEEDGADDPFDWHAEYERQLAEDLHAAFDPDATQWNSGELSGTPCEEWRALMHREAAFTYGNVKSKDKRNDTRDDAWAPKSMPVFKAIEGNTAKRRPGGKVVRAEWGLSRHVEDDHKGGSGYVLGACQGHRRAKAVTTIDAIGLDCDTGHLTYEEAVSRAREIDFAFASHTSFNHLTTESEFNYDAVVKHAHCDGEPTLEQIKNYAKDKKNLAPHIIESIEVEEMRHHSAEGLFIRVRHLPIDKYRLIFLLRSTVTIADLGNTLAEAHEVHSQKVMGLAEMVGVPTDPATLDVSRFFYAARHREGTKHHVAIHRAPPIDYDDIPTAKKPKKSTEGRNRRPDVVVETPDGVTVDVSALYDRYAKRWELATITEHCDLATSVAANNSGGKFHVVCPYADGHTDSADDTATFAMNAEDSETEFAVVKCLHGSCQGRHLVDYLGAWIESGDLDPALLEDPSYMLDFADDQEEEKFFRLTPDEKEALADEAAQAGADITTESNDDDLKAHFKALIKIGDQSAVAREVVRIADVVKHPLGKSGLNRLVKEVRTEMAADARQRATPSEAAESMDIKADATVQAEYTRARIAATNASEPTLFEYMETPAVVRGGRLKSLSENAMRHELRKICSFTSTEGPIGAKVTREVFPPKDLVSDTYESDLSGVLLPLNGVVQTPFFTKDGELVTENGYHEGSQIYLDCDLELPRVSAHPTYEEAHGAARYVVEEAFADFPLGGLSRDEIMERAFSGDGVPAVATLLSQTLSPMCRPMIDGNVPGHVTNKPVPGTGASYLVAVSSIISTGEEVEATPMPKEPNEMAKTVSSLLLNDPTIIFFENINHEIDSAELAAAMTPPKSGYQARVLGKSQMVKTPVRSVFTFAGNTLTMSDELLRRCVLIDLDRKVAEPAKFKPEQGWRHKNIRAWTEENRAALVHACLTMIQFWVVEKKMKYGDYDLASFENWAGVMGGILDACGVPGLLGNQHQLTGLSDGDDDDLGRAMQAVADAVSKRVLDGEDAFVYVSTKSDDDKQAGKFGLFDILHAMEDVPALDGWGYSVENGTPVYENTNKAGRRFKAAATRVYEVVIGGTLMNMSFERDERTKAYKVFLK